MLEDKIFFFRVESSTPFRGMNIFCSSLPSHTATELRRFWNCGEDDEDDVKLQLHSPLSRCPLPPSSDSISNCLSE